MNSLHEEVQMKLLQIDSSARTSSVTRRLTTRFAEEWRKNHPDGEVVRRDLSGSLARRCTTSRSLLRSRRGSITSCGLGKPLATVQTVHKAFSRERTLSSSLPAGARMKKVQRGQL